MSHLLKLQKDQPFTLRDLAFRSWPYLFIFISITGLAYEAFAALR